MHEQADIVRSIRNDLASSKADVDLGVLGRLDSVAASLASSAQQLSRSPQVDCEDTAP